MTKKLPIVFAMLVAASGLAACQSGTRMAMAPGTAMPASTPMDGRWASTDGIFIASFQGGEFTSVDAKTDAVLARGTYQVSRGQVEMNWLSTSSNERRSATCGFSGRNQVTCTQASGATFQLTRA